MSAAFGRSRSLPSGSCCLSLLDGRKAAISRSDLLWSALRWRFAGAEGLAGRAPAGGLRAICRRKSWRWARRRGLDLGRSLVFGDRASHDGSRSTIVFAREWFSPR